jgi:hypothetical protein
LLNCRSIYRLASIDDKRKNLLEKYEKNREEKKINYEKIEVIKRDRSPSELEEEEDMANLPTRAYEDNGQNIEDKIFN